MRSLNFQFLTLLLSVASVCGYAQENVSFTVDAPQTVTVDEVFKIDYILNTGVESGIEPYLSSVNGITPTMGPMVSRSSSSTTINGVQTDEVATTYTWYFRADRAGDLTIPYCRIETRQKTYRSESLRIKVLPNGDETPAGSDDPDDPDDSNEPVGAKRQPDPVPDVGSPAPDATPDADPDPDTDSPAPDVAPDIAPDPIEPEVTDDREAWEEAVVEKGAAPLDDKTRKALLYASIIMLALLLAAYISKLNARREAQYAAMERNGNAATKPSAAWHLPFLAGIIVLICCIAALW